MYLEFDFFPSEFNCLDFEVNPDGRDEGRVEGIVGEPEEDAGLADTRVANEQQLEEEIVTFFRHFFPLNFSDLLKLFLIFQTDNDLKFHFVHCCCCVFLV